MIRVLQVVNNMHRAGLETMLMNYYRRIDRNQIQFDFLTHRPEKDDYDDEIESLGGKVYHAPRLYPQNYPNYFKYMKQFFIDHPEYKIMHSHIDPMSYLPLKAGQKSNIPVRIAHSHNTAIDRDMKYPLKMYFRSRINTVATDRLACGEEAGKFLFGDKDFIVVPNAIETANFVFNNSVREEMRRELNLTDELVFGHVGRISYQKNHRFLVEIFSEIVKMNDKAILLLIGVGEKEDEIRQLVKERGIDDKVRFLGKRSDVNKLYQAMDAFVMPSLFEGVPVVGVEAQFAKLPCFFSDKVPVEVAFCENTKFIPLEASATEWAKTILEDMSKMSRTQNTIMDNRYDIDESYIILQDYYLKMAERIRE